MTQIEVLEAGRPRLVFTSDEHERFKTGEQLLPGATYRVSASGSQPYLARVKQPTQLLPTP